ncbi:uncharacterized protein LOC111323509 [Stylophora pistillata]|uniref:uncharacterized protein LOC111323509 n=1 Tax=Stylophora pistillata TaxID=50429 RepID=UPI000C043C15|nr:uncharacterized protein LOC111323509 [Stylophora pistillata]
MRMIVILITTLAIVLQLTAVTQAVKQEDHFQGIEWQKLPFEYINEDKTVLGTWNEKEYVIRIQISSLELDMKLVFPKSSKDFNGPPFGNDPPNLGKILKCKELPEYPVNMTCSKYQVYKQKEPGFITQVVTMTVKNAWSPMLTTMVKAWKTCFNGIGTMVNKTWNGLKRIADLDGEMLKGIVNWFGIIWKGLMDCIGKIWNGLRGLAEWIFITVMWADECVYKGSLWAVEWYWDSTEWLTELAWNGMEWVRDQTDWLAGVAKENASWLAKKAWIGLKRWAEWAWGEAKRLADWLWTEIKRNCKPFEPGFECALETVEFLIKFYKEFVHEHLLKIQVKIIISSWRETGYTILAVLVMNCVAVAVYKLI